MIALILGAVLITQAAQEPDRPVQTAVAVPETESLRHLIGDRPILRVSAEQAKHMFFSSIRVQVTVDTTGAVIAAQALGQEGPQDGDLRLPPDSLAEAESLVRALGPTSLSC